MELKKRAEGTKEETGDGLYVRVSSDHSATSHSSESLQFKLRGELVTPGESLVVVENDEMTELVMDLNGSYRMAHRRDFLYDFKIVDGGSIQLAFWMAFEGNTRDLGSFREENDKTTNSTLSLEEFCTMPRDGVAIPCDDI
ncbi:hypothetical protein Tco_0569943 [Tanacetum coccineum]